MSEREAQKRKAAERAVELVQDGMKLGLGTGSTARHVLEVLAERRSRGELQNIVGVATSRATEELAARLGIPTRSLNDIPTLDLGIDGADEVDVNLDLIKGMGGALLWEKIVANACSEFVVVVDESKLVTQLGGRSPVPVEVVPFGWKTIIKRVRELGAVGTLRMQSDAQPFITDGGHYIIDCSFEAPFHDPRDIDVDFNMYPGVVETGLFLEMATHVIVAGEAGVRLLTSPGS